MSAVEWDERYSVGVNELDEQHRGLFSIFYTLLEVRSTQQSLQEVADALAKLKAYTYNHFKLEEKYMAECDYPDLEDHRQIHNDFRQTIESFCSDILAAQKINRAELISSLYDWLVTHICSCDQQYKTYVTG